MLEVFRQLRDRARRRGERLAVSDDRGALSAGGLASHVAALAAALPDRVRTVGITGMPGASWIAADLAATLAGRRVVPVPGFFSPSQVRHVLDDAGVELLLRCDAPPASRVADPGLPSLAVDVHGAQAPGRVLPEYAGGAERVIYTSGTTGSPKGVVHGDRQIQQVVDALTAAVAAAPEDRHLSALPPSLLLEQVAGVFVPLRVGARVHVPGNAIVAALGGDPRGLMEAFGVLMPTTTVLVPQLLAGLTEAAVRGVWAPPATLRFAAVGGAPVSLALVRRARASGIPVIRGYGLSECASVVAVERPGTVADLREGCCGIPLAGLDVTIAGGEVVVRGPSVMYGYLGREPVSGDRWRTGDAGRLDADGSLIVEGRLDRVVVLPSGRNVCADWVEARVLADARFSAARLSLSPDGELELAAALRAPAGGTPAGGSGRPALHARLHGLLADLPDYARPRRIHLTRDAIAGTRADARLP